MQDFAHCNYFGIIYQDATAVQYELAPQITNLQTYTSSAQYVLFTPYVDTPQIPQQTLIINGLNLTAGEVSNPPTICVNGSCAAGASIAVTGFHLGSSWTVNETVSTGLSQIAIPYWVDPTATTGAYTPAVVTAGGSATTSFSIGDATPVITALSPSAWNSGTTTPITITGSGFGTNPSVTIAGPGITGYSITSVSDTQIIGTVTVAPLVAGQTATVQVKSNGYAGSGFQGSPGQASQVSTTLPLVPSQPAPQVLFFGSPITGPLSLVAGQEISLSVQSPPTSLTAINGSFSSSSFSQFNVPVAINGWTPGSPPTPTSNTSATPASTIATPFTFYWIAPGTFTVTYQWTVQDIALGQAPASSVITFTVSGPANPMITVNPGTSNTLGTMQVIPLSNGKISNTGTATLMPYGVACCGSVNIGKVGIAFQPFVQPPSNNTGNYSWVQTISSDTIRLLIPPSTTQTCTLVPQATLPELDNSYPYTAVEPTTSVAHDNPQDSLVGGEDNRVFSAKMFLLWLPSADARCTAASHLEQPLVAACTIPLAQGFVSWGLGGTATNTLTAQLNTATNSITTWIIDSDHCSNLVHASSFTASSNYPLWQGTFTNTTGISCSTP